MWLELTIRNSKPLNTNKTPFKYQVPKFLAILFSLEKERTSPHPYYNFRFAFVAFIINNFNLYKNLFEKQLLKHKCQNVYELIT